MMEAAINLQGRGEGIIARVNFKDWSNSPPDDFFADLTLKDVRFLSEFFNDVLKEFPPCKKPSNTPTT